MIAQSWRLCRQGVFLLPLIFQTGRGSSLRKTFVFHFLPNFLQILLTRCFLPWKEKKGNVVLLAEAFLVCQPTAGTEHTEERQQGVQAVPPWFFPLPKVVLKPLGLLFDFFWQLSQKWLHSLCPYMLNILWRCVQLTYLHLLNFVLVY